MSMPIATETVKPNGGGAIVALLGVHAVGGVVGASLSADQPSFSSGVFFALITSQATLLGMWSGLGMKHGLVRLLVLGLGIPLLANVLAWGISEADWEIHIFLLIAASLAALPTWLLRLGKVRLGRIGVETPSREGLQFTIKHLLLLTFVVACLLTLGKALAPHVRASHLLAQLTVLAICFVSVALTALWAMLGLGNPWLRGLLVMGIAVGAGITVGYSLEISRIGFWIFVSLMQAVYLLGSLFVFRKLGYRLLAHRAPEEVSSMR